MNFKLYKLLSEQKTANADYVKVSIKTVVRLIWKVLWTRGWVRQGGDWCQGVDQSLLISTAWGSRQ